jgi:hypothetical protein
LAIQEISSCHVTKTSRKTEISMLKNVEFNLFAKINITGDKERRGTQITSLYFTFNASIADCFAFLLRTVKIS